MKIIRTDTKLIVEIVEDNDGFEVVFPNVFRAHWGGFSRFEIIADDLRAVLSTMNHPLARLALNALDAERYAQMVGRPRWLVYEADSGNSFNTLLEVEGAARVEVINGRIVWFNPKGGCQ